jgi:hypothetical protein
MDQLAAKYIWAKSKEAEIKRLLGGCAPSVTSTTAGTAATYARKSYKPKNDNYCWSHGYQVVLAHKSTNCTKKGPGHKDEATKYNIMGGDTWGRKFL